MDVLTPEQRTRCMAAIKSKHTQPEILVRSALDKLKAKYVLHSIDLPGKPDIVLQARKKVILVHGCFWHVHNCRYGKVKPATNSLFWRNKRNQTRARDLRNRRALRKAGWEVLTIWECWTKNHGKLTSRLSDFLSAKTSTNRHRI